MTEGAEGVIFNGKIRRFFTSLLLPVDVGRRGECIRCGACCAFVFKCPFLRIERTDPPSYSCRAYWARPLQCRKYPRSKKEQIHQPCGYHFLSEEGTPSHRHDAGPPRA